MIGVGKGAGLITEGVIAVFNEVFGASCAKSTEEVARTRRTEVMDFMTFTYD